jgi:hypothetical protein
MAASTAPWAIAALFKAALAFAAWLTFLACEGWCTTGPLPLSSSFLLFDVVGATISFLTGALVLPRPLPIPVPLPLLAFKTKNIHQKPRPVPNWRKSHLGNFRLHDHAYSCSLVPR